MQSIRSFLLDQIKGFLIEDAVTTHGRKHLRIGFRIKSLLLDGLSFLSQFLAGVPLPVWILGTFARSLMRLLYVLDFHVCLDKGM